MTNSNLDKIDTAMKGLADGKVDKVTGKGLSTADYTTAEKNKLAGIADNANNYSHPASGVGAGTYRSVTVDTNGHVTAGSNPTQAITDGGTGATTAAQARTNLGAAAASVSVTSTLTTAGWVGSAAPYTQELSVTGATASNNIVFDMGVGVSATQLQSGIDGMLKATSQSAGKVTITAFGDKPTVDIPVQFLILG